MKNYLFFTLLCIGKSMATFSVTSTSFNNGEAIVSRYSCKGISPQFSLVNIPAKTKNLILVIDDPDAQLVVGHTFVHVIAQFDAKITKIPEGKLDTLALNELTNDANVKKYYGPCPPAGPVHHYYFTWLALDAEIDFGTYTVQDFRDTHVQKSKFYAQQKDHILAHAQIMGTFQKK